MLTMNHAAERIFGGVPPPPPISAKAAYVLDITSGVPIFAKNADFRLAPGSLIKLALAIALLRKTRDLDQRVEVEPGDIVKGSSMKLQAGDSATLHELLHGLLLASGNDAAHVIGRFIGSPIVAMNGIAHRLGMTRTRIINPSGLDVPGQYSTAHDLSLLTAEAYSMPELRTISGVVSQDIAVEGLTPRSLALVSTVKMLGEHGVLAGKTGTTHRAGACLALLSELDGRRVVTVLLGSDVRFDRGVVESSDRRYDDARTIIANLPDTLTD